MKLSARSRYGLKLLIELALNEGNGPLQLSSIARKQQISEKYLGQIVIQLKGAGFVSSGRGKNGGYFLSRDPEKLSLCEIIEKLEGTLLLTECAAENAKCPNKTSCATAEIWKEISDSISAALKKTTLKDLAHKTMLLNSAPFYEI